MPSNKKFLDETGLQLVWNKCKNTFTSKPLTKIYENITASANNANSASFYIGKIVPADFTRQWAVRYYLTVSIIGTGADASNGRSVHEVLISGSSSNITAYRIYNSVLFENYTPIKKHTFCMANSVGASTYGHLFGIDLTDSYKATDSAYKRTVIITSIEAINCTVSLFDSPVLYANASGTESENYSARTAIDASSTGLAVTNIDNLAVDTISAKNGNIYVDDRTVFNNSTDMKGDVYVGGWSGGSVVSGQTSSLRVNGTNEITGNSIVGGGLSVSGQLNVYNQAYINGNLTANNITADGSLTVSGTTRTNGDLKTQSVFPENDNEKNIGKSGHGYRQGLIYTLNTNKIHSITGNNDYTFPSKGGTFAMTSDIKTYSNGSGLKLTGDAFSVNTDYVTSGKNYKVQVDGTSGGLYVNVPWANSGGTITGVNVNGSSVVTGSTANITVPTQTSQLTNNSGFITNTVDNFTVNNNLNLTSNATVKYNATEDCIDFIFN